MSSNQIPDLFEKALAISDQIAREAYVVRECGNDEDLAQELRSLLTAHEQAGEFLEDSAIEEAAAILPSVLGSNLIGQFIGAWRVDSLVQAGGMGSVFRATRIEDDFTQEGALKLVRVGFETPELVARFSRERRLLATVEHPNIARLLDGGTTEEGLPWLAMEFVDGLPIDVYASTKELSLRERLELFDGLTEAIAYLHENLITHRDIKASNVLVDRAGRPRVLDFGIANLLDDAAPSQHTSADRRLSLSTTSPEQLRGQAISTATDVYSLGVLLYQLLTGDLPYRLSASMTAREIEELICERVPPLASQSIGAAPGVQESAGAKLRPGALRGDLDTIVATCLQKDPNRRYRTVTELRADLQRYREHRPINARPDSTVYQASKFVLRHWRGLAATIATILALAVGLAMAVWQADEARRQRDRAQAMNEFMQEVLAEADPYEADLNKTVREALQEASELLDARFQGQPRLESSLRTSVGSVQLSLLDLETGEANLLRARDLLQPLVSSDNEQLLNINANLAWLFFEREQYQDSIAAYEAILSQFNDGHEADFRATTYNDLGLVLAEEERYQEALDNYDRALVLAPKSKAVPATLINMGYVHDGLGNLEEAKDYYQQAIDILRSRGEDGVGADLAYSLNNYGNILSQQDRDDEALPFYLESLSVRYQVYGEEADAVAFQHMNIGRLLLDMERPQEALAHLDTAVRMFPKFRDEDSIRLRVARASHARALLLTTKDLELRAEAIDSLDNVVTALKTDSTVRSSRFLGQFVGWLEEARSQGSTYQPQKNQLANQKPKLVDGI
ncbi:MAG: serine/threonine-protein kinase [Pseudomonadota bacterium]